MQSMTLKRDEGSEVADFMRQQFADRFDAELDVAASELYGAYVRGELVAAFGLRTKNDGLASRVYCEEALLRRLSDVPAEQVAEVVHLCGRDARSVLRMLPRMAKLLEARGYQSLVFTATRCLRRIFARRGWQLDDLGPADADVLAPEQRKRWGGYYQSAPHVLVGSLAQAVRIVDQTPELKVA